MKVELVVALIAGAVALMSAGATAWSSRAIAQLQIDNQRLLEADTKRKTISNFSEPLTRSAYDLQSRFYNIINKNFIGVYLVHGDSREKSYVINNTTFLIGQYLCWNELVRREIQFIDLGENGKTHELLHLQDSIYGQWGTDKQPPVLRLFAGEQRAIGEALIQNGTRGPECMGYSTFLKSFNKSEDPLVDDLRQDVASLGTNLSQATTRITNLQHALIDLLTMLDPTFLRFPKDSRLKI